MNRPLTRNPKPKSDTAHLSGLIKAGALVLNVRTAQEFIRTKLPNARHTPLEQLHVLAKSIKNWQRPVITYSTDGRRSALAADLLRSQGINARDGGKREDLESIIQLSLSLPGVGNYSTQ